MKELIIVPFMAMFILGFAMELSHIAQDASAKSLTFADDMSNAIPCAARGIPIFECSPNLAQTSFEPEVNRTITSLEKFQKEMEQEIKRSKN